MKIRAHVFVRGKVQGVFFRQTTKREADSLGVKGWIQNLSDGRVEAVFEGEDDLVKMMIDFIRHGPSRAKVSIVDLVWEDYIGEFKVFRVAY